MYALKMLCMIPCNVCIKSILIINFIITYLCHYGIYECRVNNKVKSNKAIATMYALKMLSIYTLLRNIKTKLSINFIIAYLCSYRVIVSRVDKQIKCNNTIATMYASQILRMCTGNCSIKTKLSINFVVAYLRHYCIIVSRVDKQIKCNKAVATMYALKILSVKPCL